MKNVTKRSLSCLFIHKFHILSVCVLIFGLYKIHLTMILNCLFSVFVSFPSNSHCVFATFEGSVTPITEQELLAVTNNVHDIKRNHSVVFAVTAPPKLGRLVRHMPDNSTQDIFTFTQSMVGMNYCLCG